jgi:hypothetical protein
MTVGKGIPDNREASEEAHSHDRPLEPPDAPGYIEQLVLTNPNMSIFSPTPASVLSIQDGYWLAAGNDLYKLSPHGDILAHKVYPYHWYSSLLFISALTLRSDGFAYALVSNINATYLPSALVRIGNMGETEKQWNFNDILGSNAVIEANDALVAILDFIPAQSLVLIDTASLYSRRIEGFNDEQQHINLYSMAVDKEGHLWVGVDGGGRDSIESQILRLNADETFWEGTVFRALVEEERPEHHGGIQGMVSLPGGGWVVSGLMGYFQENNPCDSSWKYYSFLAEIAADGSVVWAQLFEDLDLVGLKRDPSGGLWGFGYAWINGNVAEAQLIARFTSTGEPQWAVERREKTYYYDDIRSGQVALTPDGGLALGWTTQNFHELWFGVLDPSRPLEGCDTFRFFDLSSRWRGPVTIETRPADVQAVESDPVAIWEEPVEMWDGEGEVTGWCGLHYAPYRGGGNKPRFNRDLDIPDGHLPSREKEAER